MRKIFYVFLLSLFCHSSLFALSYYKSNWYSKDTVQVDNINTFSFQGDSALCRLLITYNNPSDLNNMIYFDIDGDTIFSGTVQDLINKNFWISLKFPFLPYKKNYIYPINFNGSSSSAMSLYIYPSGSIPSRSFLIEYLSSDTIKYNDSAYVAIKFSNVGQWKSYDYFAISLQNNSDFSSHQVFTESVFNADSIIRNSNGLTLFKFKVPTNVSTGNCHYHIAIIDLNNNANNVYIPDSNVYLKSSTVASIIDPINPPSNIKIHYYNIQGEEIEKPSQGFAIWRAETGESGKIYLSN